MIIHSLINSLNGNLIAPNGTTPPAQAGQALPRHLSKKPTPNGEGLERVMVWNGATWCRTLTWSHSSVIYLRSSRN
ncbi:MAG: hypothetical protein PHV20_02140 [Bacteroidales bacterium]|nr:hypothetical protein [Bacteroidales bacterium]